MIVLTCQQFLVDVFQVRARMEARVKTMAIRTSVLVFLDSKEVTVKVNKWNHQPFIALPVSEADDILFALS